MKKFTAIFLSVFLSLAMLSFSVNAAYSAGNALDEKTSTLEGVSTEELASLGWKAFSSGSVEIATEEGNSYVHFKGPKNQYSAPSVNVFPAIKKLSGGDDACICIVLKLRFGSSDKSFDFATAGMVIRSTIETSFTPNSGGTYYVRLNPVDSIEGDCGQWITVVAEYIDIPADALEEEAVWSLTFDRLGPDGDEAAMQQAGAYVDKFTIDIDDVAIYDADYYDANIADNNGGDKTETPDAPAEPTEVPADTPAPTQAPTQAPTAPATTAPATTAPTTTDEGGSNTGLIIGIVIASVVVAAGIIAFVVIKKKKEQ